MANLNSVLNDRIARVARKEIRSMIGATKKASAVYRRVIAALKRETRSLTRRLSGLEAVAGKAVKQMPAQLPQNVRFSTRSVRAQRRRLGLSALHFGKLVGVSGLTIYSWESGKSRPRRQQLAKLVSVRGIGKREALKRLEMLGAGKKIAVVGSRRGATDWPSIVDRTAGACDEIRKPSHR